MTRPSKYYEIIIDRPEQVAQLSLRNINRVVAHRRKINESYAFNWGLTIPESMQMPFYTTHESMAALQLDPSLPRGELISQLRKAYSGLVAGNVKAYGIRQIEQHGPFRLKGDAKLMAAMDTMLKDFVAHKRMKISADDYRPCYTIE